jgi:putative zinc finger protein
MMTKQSAHPAADLIRYLDGELVEEDKRKIEAHLSSCPECRERLAFARDFNRGLTQLSAEELSPREPCPNAETLVRYEAGEVDEETAEHLRAHMVFCDACRDDYYSLRRLSREESWQGLIERAKQFVIDLGKRYGSDALVGSVRILAEQPALARGGESSQIASKVLGTSVGQNTYSIQVDVTKEGGVACDIAGVRTPVKISLSISAFSESAGELISAKTDEFGNLRFILPSGLDDLLLLTLNLEGDKQEVLLRIPESKEPA